jgi:hypothetical protein
LLAIKLVPSQTPLPLVDTQVLLDETFPDPHIMQSFDVPPVHVWHKGEQGWQTPLLLKLPSGQTVPSEAVCGVASHLVRSFASWVKPVLQVMQLPLESAHCAQPS